MPLKHTSALKPPSSQLLNISWLYSFKKRIDWFVTPHSLSLTLRIPPPSNISKTVQQFFKFLWWVWSWAFKVPLSLVFSISGLYCFLNLWVVKPPSLSLTLWKPHQIFPKQLNSFSFFDLPLNKSVKSSFKSTFEYFWETIFQRKNLLVWISVLFEGLTSMKRAQACRS